MYGLYLVYAFCYVHFNALYNQNHRKCCIGIHGLLLNVMIVVGEKNTS